MFCLKEDCRDKEMEGKKEEDEENVCCCVGLWAAYYYRFLLKTKAESKGKKNAAIGPFLYQKMDAPRHSHASHVTHIYIYIYNEIHIEFLRWRFHYHKEELFMCSCLS
jgi:hypothetical protein